MSCQEVTINQLSGSADETEYFRLGRDFLFIGTGLGSSGSEAIHQRNFNDPLHINLAGNVWPETGQFTPSKSLTLFLNYSSAQGVNVRPISLSFGPFNTPPSSFARSALAAFSNAVRAEIQGHLQAGRAVPIVVDGTVVGIAPTRRGRSG